MKRFIDQLTVSELRELADLLSSRGSKRAAGRNHSIPVGEAVFIRTVTHYYTGRVDSVTATDVKLVDAAWIADSGRYSDALEKGTLNEVDPIPDYVLIGRGAIVDVVPWRHELPRKQK